MGRNAVVIIIMNLCYGCVFCQSDTSAYLYKLNYDVPESPALSIIDANPAKVMRGSASKEFAVNLIKNFATKNRQEAGVAIDFNPYFILGGQLKNATEYDNNYLKRVLANTQFSVASVYSDEMPDDNILSGGVRITLWDDFDLLQDDSLRQDIDRALIPPDSDMGDPNSDLNDFGNNQGELLTITTLSRAYERAKERIKNRKGFALSLGMATARILKGGIIAGDSLMKFRNQVWVAGQYQPINKLNVLGSLMFRQTFNGNKDTLDVLGGVGLRYMGRRVNVGGEIAFSKNTLTQFGVNFEVGVSRGIWLNISVGNEPQIHNEQNRLMIKPTLRYNLGQ